MWDPSYTKSEVIINKDTYFMKHTYRAAIEAVRATLLALHQIKANKFKHFYSVIRPPGHHSGLKSQPHGFCFLNSIAITAEYAIRQKMASKIAIVDWDAHHG
jgi:acetoin utilization deacetylase AcuC-like enzyme